MSVEEKLIFKLAAAEAAIASLEGQVDTIKTLMKLQQSFIESLEVKESPRKSRVLCDVVYRLKQLETKTSHFEEQALLVEDLHSRLTRAEATLQGPSKGASPDELLKVERRCLYEIDLLRQEIHKQPYNRSTHKDTVRDLIEKALKSRDEVMMELKHCLQRREDLQQLSLTNTSSIRGS
jgi:hypothetical protein